MPVRETCAVCGLDLFFVHGSKDGEGEYYHQFRIGFPGSYDFLHKYKFIHIPVPVLLGDISEHLKEEAYVPAQGWSGEFRKETV